jgi:zinc finger CCHC domain-containing protein 9
MSDQEVKKNKPTRAVKSRKNKNKKEKKLKEFQLSEEDQIIIDADIKDLRGLVVSSLEEKISELEGKIDEVNKNENDKKIKKTLVGKLRQCRHDLADEEIIKKRVNLLKLRKRKLAVLNNKIQDRLSQIKKKNVRCLLCKKRGHMVSECREKKEDVGNLICYNCGSNEHNLFGCSKKVDYSNLPFAECFICKEMGHLSANCPTSDKGIYFKGGSCFICQGKDHLAKNCPKKQLIVEDEEPKTLLNKKRKNI